MLIRVGLIQSLALTLLSACFGGSYELMKVSEVTTDEGGNIVVTVHAGSRSGDDVPVDLGWRVLSIRDDRVDCSIVPRQQFNYSDASLPQITRYLENASSPSLVVGGDYFGTSFFDRGPSGWQLRWTLEDTFPKAAWIGADGQIRVLTDTGLFTVPADRSAPSAPASLSGCESFTRMGRYFCLLAPTTDTTAAGVRFRGGIGSMVQVTCDGASCNVEGGGPDAGRTGTIGGLVVQADGEPVYVFLDGILGAGPPDRIAVVSPRGRQADLVLHQAGLVTVASRPGGGFVVVAWSREGRLVVFVRDVSGRTRVFELGDLEQPHAAPRAVVTGSGDTEQVHVYVGLGGALLREITLDPVSEAIESRDIAVCGEEP